MRTLFVLISVLLYNICSLSVAYAQNTEDGKGFFRELGIESQFYPAGFMKSVRGMHVISKKSALSLKLGYNKANRQDFGVHDDEQGGGPGMAVGYRYYIMSEDHSGLFVAARLSLWFMNINWEDNQLGENDKGSTFIGVIQPTFAGGYQYVSDSNWSFGVGVAFGIEWNAMSNGKEVGQGGISLINFSVGRRF